MLLLGVTSVHTLGMRYSLDIVFLSADLAICGLVEGLSPNHIAIGRGAVHHTLELPAGAISDGALQLQDRLAIRDDLLPQAS